MQGPNWGAESPGGGLPDQAPVTLHTGGSVRAVRTEADEHTWVGGQLRVVAPGGGD
jgi:hypothetical protein